MSSVPTNHALILAAILFVLGALGVMTRRNLVFVLMSVEIMLNAAAVAFVAAASKWRQPDGQVIVIFILVVAAAEVAVGLSLLLRIYHNWKSVDVDEVSLMRG
jgi:NADH-quinone oxidoreductase subunit K